jgi:hypothetical protein
MESVFWPTIQTNVIARAIAFASTMANATSRAAYLSALPGSEYRPGRVYIHHTTPIIHQTPTAYVAYDTVFEGGSAAARHFDESGVEFRLPQELLPPPAPLSTK